MASPDASTVHAVNHGDRFASFKEVEDAISRLEQSQKITYWKRDTRTIEAALKRGVKIPFAPALKYYQISYACVKGGRTFKSLSKGQRPNQSTFREDCGAFVRFCASKDGRHLVVVKCVLEHNHSTSKETFKLLPKQRRLNENELPRVETFMRSKPDRKVLREVRKVTGKMMTVRDLMNQRLKMKTDLKITGSADDGGDIEVLVDEVNMLKGIYYQDDTMKNNFHRYPELLLVDATYKLNQRQMPVYIMMSVDGNGDSDIVCVFVVVLEGAELMAALLDMFKSHNPAWEKTKTILTDKEFAEKSIYRENFPGATLQLCLFHVLRTMRRDVLAAKMAARPNQKKTALEIFQRIASSADATQYEATREELRRAGPRSVVDYFDRVWHPIREQWVVGLKQSCHYNNHTSSRLECINQKLKQVIAKFSCLNSFFRDLKLVIVCLRQDRDSRLAKVLMKRSFLSHDPGTAEFLFSKLLTPYSYQLVLERIELSKQIDLSQSQHIDLSQSQQIDLSQLQQIDLSQSQQIDLSQSQHIDSSHEKDLSLQIDLSEQIELSKQIEIGGGEEGVTLQTPSGTIQVTPTSCTCQFVRTNELPCEHVFALRANLGLQLYLEDCVAQRWLLGHYRDRPAPATLEQERDDVPVPGAGRVYDEALVEAKALAMLASEQPQRLQVLRKLVRAWRDGQPADVVVSEPNSAVKRPFLNEHMPPP